MSAAAACPASFHLDLESNAVVKLKLSCGIRHGTAIAGETVGARHNSVSGLISAGSRIASVTAAHGRCADKGGDHHRLRDHTCMYVHCFEFEFNFNFFAIIIRV